MVIKPTYEELEQRIQALEYTESKGKLVEVELRESVERYRRITEEITDYLYTCFIQDGKVVETIHGPACEVVTGYTIEDFAADPYLWIKMVFPDDHNQVNEFINMILSGKQPQPIEHRIVRKSGQICWVSDTPILNFDSRGTLLSYDGVIKDISERKRSDEELQVNEIKYRLLFENAGDAIFIHDAQARILEVNPVACKQLGYTYEELLSMTINQVDSPEQARHFPERTSRLVKHSHISFETVHLRKDGTPIPLDVSTRLISWQGLPAMISICRNITERKQTEAAIRSSEEEMRLTIDATTEGIWKWNFKTNELFFSSRYYTMLGYEPNEFAATFENWKALIHPDDRASAMEMATAYLKGKVGDYRNRFRLKTKTGNYLWISASARIAERDQDGEAVRIIGNHQDVTERMQMEEALRESEEKYRSMMESMEDSAYICSAEFLIEYMNPAMIKRVGREVTGQSCYEAIHGFDNICPWCQHENIQKGEYIRTELVSPKDQKTYHVSSSPIFKRNGSVSNLNIFRDISEIKTMKIRLQQAQKMESIGSLAGGIAHDFNNILFPILGMSEMLLEDLPSGSLAHQNAQEIYDAGIRGSDLVKQILAFSRQSEHKKIPVGIQKVLREVLKLCRRTIPSDIEITQSIQIDCGLVNADPTQVHQIAMNLITNAYHAVEMTGGEISINLHETELLQEDLSSSNLEPSRYAVLTISDTGCGIEPTCMDKIFEPYFTTKEKGKGTGLGLAVVYGIVKEHHGDIKVTSEVGKGTSFSVYIPLIRKKSDTIKSDKIEIHPTGDEMILLVDDEESVLRLENQMLGRLGYRVTMRNSATDALMKFRANPEAFDLVVSDMNMPNMTGEQLSRKLMAIRPNIPVIICTGFSERIDKEKAHAIGIKGFLMKPVVKSEMAQMVRNVLDEAKASNIK